MNTEKSLQALLRSMGESDNIELIGLLNDEMSKLRKKRLENVGKHEIYQSSNGRWETYVQDSTRIDGRRRISKRTESELYKFLEDFYGILNESKMEFNKAYEMWFSRKCLDYTSTRSKRRQESLYNRHFRKSSFGKIFLKDLTEDKIVEYIYKEIKEKNLRKQACSSLISTVEGVLFYARKNGYLQKDLFEFIEKKKFYRHCDKTIKTVEEQTLSPQEWETLNECIETSIKRKPSYIVPLAVLLYMECGFRLSEGIALKWSDIKNGYIHIVRSEKLNEETREVYISTTKTGKARRFPVTPNIQAILERVKETEEYFGLAGEYIFNCEDGRITASKVDKYVRKKIDRCITDIRKTVISNLKCQGVPTAVVASWMGHTVEVDDNYYTQNILPLETELSYLNKAV